MPFHYQCMSTLHHLRTSISMVMNLALLLERRIYFGIYPVSFTLIWGCAASKAQFLKMWET
uniref:Uncharacterized protein n=1 Tax=Arundo donax TaxID=35708 RepID=A0A0A8YZL1_ARUDO